MLYTIKKGRALSTIHASDASFKKGGGSMDMIKYVEQTHQSFESLAFNAVDSLVLSQLAYLHYNHLMTKTYLKDLQPALYLESLLGSDRNDKDNKKLIEAICESPRFGTISLDFYQEELSKSQEKQFAAVTFLLEDGSNYIAFRGTDATLIGWKEDFTMSFRYPVPAQEAARKYLEAVASLVSGPILVGGHSKGGNLAVYACCKASDYVQQRLKAIYSYDGPGFHPDFLKELEQCKVKDKIHKYVPQSSLIGMLLYTQEQYRIVKSREVLIMQHDPFSWEIANNHFVIMSSLSSGTKYTNKVLNDWIASLSKEECENFVDALFEVLSSTGATTLKEFARVWQKKIPSMIVKMHDLSPEMKNHLWDTMKSLVVLAIKNLKEFF